MVALRLWYRVEPKLLPSSQVNERQRLHTAWERLHGEFRMNACCYCVDTSIGGHMEACFFIFVGFLCQVRGVRYKLVGCHLRLATLALVGDVRKDLYAA